MRWEACRAGGSAWQPKRRQYCQYRRNERRQAQKASHAESLLVYRLDDQDDSSRHRQRESQREEKKPRRIHPGIIAARAGKRVGRRSGVVGSFEREIWSRPSLPRD